MCVGPGRVCTLLLQFTDHLLSNHCIVISPMMDNFFVTWHLLIGKYRYYMNFLQTDILHSRICFKCFNFFSRIMFGCWHKASIESTWILFYFLNVCSHKNVCIPSISLKTFSLAQIHVHVQTNKQTFSSIIA